MQSEERPRCGNSFAFIVFLLTRSPVNQLWTTSRLFQSSSIHSTSLICDGMRMRGYMAQRVALNCPDEYLLIQRRAK